MKKTNISTNKLFYLSIIFMNSPAIAQKAFSYHYFEFGVNYSQNIFPTVGSLEGIGFFIDGALDVTEQIYFGGFYDRKDVNKFNFGIANYGVFSGYHINIKPNLDVYGEIRAFRFDSGVLGIGLNGLGLGTGLRLMVSEKIELDASIYLDRLESRSSYSTIALESKYFLSKNRSLELKVEQVDGQLESQLGIRFSF